MAPKTKQNQDQKKSVNTKKKIIPETQPDVDTSIVESTGDKKKVVTETETTVVNDNSKNINNSDENSSDLIAVETKFIDLLDKLQTIIGGIKYIVGEVKILQKEYSKVKKAVGKKRGVNPNTKRNPSGFAKPTPLDDALADFLGVPKGTQKSRTEVTKSINEYIKKNNLQEPSDKRNFIPDKKLSTILDIEPGEKPSYFSLQRLIKRHFKKETEV